MSASSAPRKRKRRRAPSRPGLRRVLRLLLGLSPLLLVPFVFSVTFVLDPEAVARLLWACVSGHFGEPAQIAGTAAALSVAAATAWAFRPDPSEPTRRRGTPAQRQTKRRKAQADGAATEDVARQAPDDQPKRRTRKRRARDAAVVLATPETEPNTTSSPAVGRKRSAVIRDGGPSGGSAPRGSGAGRSPKPDDAMA